jgi:hypothetical protein
MSTTVTNTTNTTTVTKQLGKTLDEMPIYDGTQINVLVFRPNLLSTLIDPNTGFAYWVTPVFNNTPDEVKQYLSSKNLHYIQYDNKPASVRAYEKYTSKVPTSAVDIPVLTNFGGFPNTYEEKRDYTALKETIGNRITSAYYAKHQGRATSNRDLQIKGVDRVVDGKYVDDKYIFGNYEKFGLEVSNPQFKKHSGGLLDGDKLTDYIYWWEFLYCRLTIIDYKKLKKWYEQPIVQACLPNFYRDTKGHSANGTINADIPWSQLEQAGVIVSRKHLEYSDLN